MNRWNSNNHNSIVILLLLVQSSIASGCRLRTQLSNFKWPPSSALNNTDTHIHNGSFSSKTPYSLRCVRILALSRSLSTASASTLLQACPDHHHLDRVFYCCQHHNLASSIESPASSVAMLDILNRMAPTVANNQSCWKWKQRLTRNVLLVGGNSVSAFLSWRLQATTSCDVTLVWKNGFENASTYGISFK